ncbi:uncharacterized protein E0L32_006260 [Thyridium curvatum]|uniref:Uncharacterized protein n=1 Tax=Thyridium curvatum TaxID=1093900 RepID=A0A507B0N4_9PEZI|nr:uncharacterized protein E0L32_006260 [Thyridium curvatum]TPX13287.1 hypothetical protein E0L32_006260 [Thyridium curvatum]
MHSYRGRTGPSRSTPANVQCQKCLKRDKSLAPSPCSSLCNKLTFLERHYSYECKAAPQERPYAARPSRSQQLRNPKLVPKLTEATPDEVERKKGVADAELAKKEAERARKRELEGGDDGKLPSKRQRSASFDSVSSISTRSSRSPPPARRTADQPGGSRRGQSRSRSSSGSSRFGRSRSPDSDGDARRPQNSPPPALRTQDTKEVSRRDRSLSSGSRSRSRSFSPENKPSRQQQSRMQSSDFFGDARAPERRRRDSRSPDRSSRARQGRERDGRRQYRARDDAPPRRDERPSRPEPPRQRSLSPFSKRLALTQAMNTGR